MSKFAWRVPGVKRGLNPTLVPLLALVAVFQNVPRVKGSSPFPAKMELREKPISRFFRRLQDDLLSKGKRIRWVPIAVQASEEVVVAHCSEQLRKEWNIEWKSPI